MREASRWIVWKAVTNQKTGKVDKIPHDPRTQKRFRRDTGWQNNPAMWATYDEVNATGWNLGFLLGDGWAGIDIDDVIVNGVTADWALRLIKQFDTYAEISPSLTGIKLFMRGSITDDDDRRIGKRAGIEVYDRQRFFTVTGRAMSPAPIADCTEALQGLYDTLKRGDVLDLLRLRGLLLSTGKPGYIDMHCPWAEEHSGGGNATSTSIHVTGTSPDYKADGFSCFHAHCAERSLGDLRKWLGLPAWDSGRFKDVDSRTGKPSNNSQENIRIALEDMGVEMSYDEFQRRPLITWPDYRGYDGPFEDAVRNRLWLKIDEQFKFRPTPEFFDTVLRDLARQRGFHPVREYLNR
jgi:hypothetical protein